MVQCGQYLSHAAKETDGVAERLQTPQHQKRLLLEFPLVVLSGRENHARPRGGGVVHDQ